MTVIADDAVNSATFLRFEVPNVREWSIGFLYHDTGDDSFSATLIWGGASNNIFARHWTRQKGVTVHDPPNERIDPGVIRSGRGQFNELSFRTTSRGSSVRLNDETVLEVPASQLSRSSGRSRLCVGFHSNEDEPYSIRYRDLRTRFKREGVSGSLTHDGVDDGKVGCPKYRSEGAYIERYAADSWFVLDFTVPYVEKWSFGIIHHFGVDRRNSRTYISSNGSLRYAHHTTYDNGEFSDGPEQYIPVHQLTPGATVRLEFETTNLGNSLYLDGSKILSVSSLDLTRRNGSASLCTGLIIGETEPYTIYFSNFWAWAD